MFLGYRLKELRQQKNISQTELGNLLGVTKVSISGYERGTRIPSMEVLYDILNFFDVSADYLLGREMNIICEDSQNVSILLASNDINIIRQLRNFPSLYNEVAKDPKRFFSSIYKKGI